MCTRTPGRSRRSCIRAAAIILGGASVLAVLKLFLGR
jgi:hypothetical protein